MKISEVRTTASNVSLNAKVIEKRDVREVNTKFGLTHVGECVIEDETGNIVLVLWGDQTGMVNEGDTVKITNGYVKEWNGALQINIGKFGKIEVV